MDLKALIAKMLESEDFGQEAVDVLQERISKLNNENKNLRKKKKSAEKTVDEIMKSFSDSGLEIDNDDTDDNNTIEHLKKMISSLKKTQKEDDEDGNKKVDPEMIKMKKQIAELLKQSEIDAKEKAELKSTNQKSKIINHLQKSFTDSIANGDKVLKLLVNSSDSPFTIEDGEVAFKLADGDIITGQNEIMEEYKKLNPSEVLNKFQSGNGSQPGKKQIDIPSKIKSKSDIDKLSQEQMNTLMSNPETSKQVLQVLSNNSTE